jgi:hypothetical protein
MRTKLNISSSYPPRIDGLSERTRGTIQQILRSFVHQHDHDWLNLISFTEFAYNITVHSATKFPPFEAIYGLNPLNPASLLTNSPTFAPLEVIAKVHDIHDLITD